MTARGRGRGGVGFDEGGVGVAGGQGVESGEEFVAVLADDDGAVVEDGPGADQRPAHLFRCDLGVGGHAFGQCRGLAAQRLTATRGHHPWHHTTHRTARVRRGGGLGRFGGLLKDQMSVRTADAERRHTRTARPSVRRPFDRFGQQPHLARAPVHMRCRLVDVQRGGEHPVPQRLHHLDDARHSGGGLGVPDVGLDGAQPQRMSLRPILAVGGQQRLGLDRVTQRRTRTVCLHRVHLGWRHPRVGQRLPDHPLLRGPVGRRKTVAGPVLVDRRTPDHRQHPMPVAPCVGQPFQQHQTDALGEARAVRRRGERLAPPVRGQRALTRELGEPAGRGHHRHPARQRQRTLVLSQRLHRQMRGHQGRRARRVHRDRGPLQAERVRHPARDHAAEVPGGHIARRVAGRLADERQIVVRVHSGEHPGAAAAQRLPRQPRALERLPRRLQQQPLLRIHRRGLARVDPEELGVEIGHIAQKPALAGAAGTGVLRVRVIEVLQVPATVLGKRGDDIHALVNHPPQVLGGRHIAGEVAGHPDDGDGLPGAVLDLTQLPPGQTQIGGRPLEIAAELLVIRHIASTRSSRRS